MKYLFPIWLDHEVHDQAINSVLAIHDDAIIKCGVIMKYGNKHLQKFDLSQFCAN